MIPVLCACECGLPAPIARRSDPRRGHRAGEPIRFISGHHGRRRVFDAQRFWARVEKTDTCWNWMGQRAADGYGRVYQTAGAPTRAAHRVAYELLVGPIPAGLTLDHLCRNPACVNPAHLEPVPIRENILRGDGLAARNALKIECSRGHPFDERNTKVGMERGRPRRQCRACEHDRWLRRRKP